MRTAAHQTLIKSSVARHHISSDVKFLTPLAKKRAKKFVVSNTQSDDDATRVRALKVYEKHTQAKRHRFIDHIVEKFPFRIRRSFN